MRLLSSKRACKITFTVIINSKSEFKLCQSEVQRGYADGSDLHCPMPDGGYHPAYVHGFLNARDDREVARGIRRTPRRTHAEIKQAWRDVLALLDAV
jgi:hypothetical protein